MNRRLEIGILADDLTGALASAARLQRQGLNTHVQWDREHSRIPLRTEALVIDMRSRDAANSIENVRSWARYLGYVGCLRLELRIDSAIRGRPAAELEAVIHELALDDPLVIAVPAFVSAGRTTVFGQQLVRGQPCADVADRLFDGHASVVIDERHVARGPTAIIGQLEAALESGVRRAVIDGSSDRHLRAAAHAVEHLASQHRSILTMSPGGWLTHYPRLPEEFVFAVLGSPTDENREQLAVLVERFSPHVISLDASPMERDAIDLAASVVVLESISRSPAPLEGERLAATLADAALNVLRHLTNVGRSCAGVVVSGGHTAAHVVTALGATAIQPSAACESLCGAGTIVGGSWNGTPIATKGGAIGHRAVLAELVEQTFLPRRTSRAFSPQTTHKETV